MEIILFEKSSSSFKKLKHLEKKNIFIIYSLRAVKIEPATSMEIDTEMAIFTSKFKRAC